MQSRTIKVAIVDDHAIFRRGLAGIINSFPAVRVHGEYENGSDFLEALGSGAVKPDICILDIEMRLMNGYDTMSQLAEGWPDLHVLVVSAHESDFAVLKMITLGAHGYLSKNTTPEELEEAIRFIDEHGYYHSELVGSKIVNQKHVSLMRSISPADIRYISYLCSEYSMKELAELLGKSPRTLEKRSETLYKRLGLSSRTGLAVFAAQAGIKPCEPRSQ